MPQVAMRSPKRSADLLLNDDREPARRQVSPLRAGNRAQPLQGVLNVVGDLLVAPKVPVMASYLAGKIYQKLGRCGDVSQFAQDRPEIIEHWQRALTNLADGHSRLAELSTHLSSLSDTLVWRNGRSGPFASLRFEKSHAHTVLVGPGGIEERSDVRIGLTLMAPYSRFPDHVQFHSRVFLLLSDGEVCLDDDIWFRANRGTIFFNEAGRKFAMRCTGEPFLALWCQIEDASL